jgi:hypothetical protein
MTPLHRHQIAWLSRAGWQRLLYRDWDAEALACLRCWAEQCLPVVVTRQPDPMDDEAIAVGLCAPARWRHRRLALGVARADVLYFDEFPRLEKVVGQLPASARAPARRLACATARTSMSGSARATRRRPMPWRPRWTPSHRPAAGWTANSSSRLTAPSPGANGWPGARAACTPCW